MKEPSFSRLFEAIIQEISNRTHVSRTPLHITGFLATSCSAAVKPLDGFLIGFWTLAKTQVHPESSSLDMFFSVGWFCWKRPNYSTWN